VKLYHYEGTRTFVTEGYVIAHDEASARADAEELADATENYLWEDEFGVDIYVHEADPSKLKKSDYIWSGGADGTDVSVERAIEILSTLQEGERPPEYEGQERI